MPQEEQLTEEFIREVKTTHCSSMPVIDPDGANTGVYTIFLPWEAVYLTSAIHRMLRRKKPHPSLCMLFQRGKCKVGSNCNQVHANVDVVSQLRLSGAHDCCLLHGDVASNDPNFLFGYLLQTGEMLMTSVQCKVRVPWERLARTACLDRLLEKKADSDRRIRFTMSHVCRLHQEQKCRFGHDCHHIHLCRSWWTSLDEDLPPSLRRFSSPLPRGVPEDTGRPYRQRSAPQLLRPTPREPLVPPETSERAVSRSFARLRLDLTAHHNLSAPDILPPTLRPASPDGVSASMSFIGSAFTSSTSNASQGDPPASPGKREPELGLQPTRSCWGFLLDDPPELDTLLSGQPEDTAAAAEDLLASACAAFSPLALTAALPDAPTATPSSWVVLDIFVEPVSRTVRVALDPHRGTLADVRPQIELEAPFVFVVDCDVISFFEERYLRAPGLAHARVIVRSVSKI
eukprot:EG_transcript_6688